MLTPETPSLTSGDSDEIPFTTRRCSRRPSLVYRGVGGQPFPARRERKWRRRTR